MVEKIKTPWGEMSLRQAANKANVVPQTFWYRYQLYQQGKCNKAQLFARVPRLLDRTTDKELKAELRKRGYKITKNSD